MQARAAGVWAGASLRVGVLATVELLILTPKQRATMGMPAVLNARKRTYTTTERPSAHCGVRATTPATGVGQLHGTGGFGGGGGGGIGSELLLFICNMFPPFFVLVVAVVVLVMRLSTFLCIPRCRFSKFRLRLVNGEKPTGCLSPRRLHGVANFSSSFLFFLYH
jgi:hypothetical protein